MKNNCTSLYVLSAIACQLAECLDIQSTEILAADLSVLSEMLESLLARRSIDIDA